MSWEMAMASALISCRPQIPWDPARGQETGAPLECQMACLILLSEKKEAILCVIPVCMPWRCQELRDGWGRGREREARKIRFSFPGNTEAKPVHATGARHALKAVLVTASEAVCPFLPFLQGDTSKSPPCENPKRGNIDLDPSQLRCHGTVGLQENGCHR